MNTALLEAFLLPVVTDACAALQITARDSSDYMTFDPRVLLCSKIAYSVCCAYTNRPFVLDQYNEYYVEEDTIFKLRTLPIVSIEQIVFVDDPQSMELTNTDISVPLVVDVDYTVRFNKELRIFTSALTKSIGNPERVHILVSYTGGLELSSDDPVLHTGLCLQTVAIYNRMPALGTLSIQGSGMAGNGHAGQMSIASSPDAGDLLDTVKTILSPYIYCGSAESV